MKFIKTFGLAAVAAVIAMAFVGASSASATLSTQLCKVHMEPCPGPSIPASLHFVAGTIELKSNFPTVLCLASLFVGATGALALAPNPYKTVLTVFTWSNCGTNAAHNNCTVLATALGELDVLRTVLNLGTAKTLGLTFHVVCTGIMDCEFGGPEITGFTTEGALHTANAGHGLLIANALPVPKVAGGFLCPTMAKLTAKYESLEHLFIVG